MSALEVAMFVRAYRGGLLAHEMSRPVFGFGVKASLLPVGFFLLSVPVAFLDTTVAVAVWFLTIPGELLLNRAKPPGTEDWF